MRPATVPLLTAIPLLGRNPPKPIPAIAPDPSVYDSIKESMRAASSAPEAEETDGAETHENSPIDLSEIFTDDAVIAAAA